jgi:hypothetical protein
MHITQKNIGVIKPFFTSQRLAAYSAAAGAACAVQSAAQANGVLYDNGGAGWTATLSTGGTTLDYMDFGLNGVVDVASTDGTIPVLNGQILLTDNGSGKWQYGAAVGTSSVSGDGFPTVPTTIGIVNVYSASEKYSFNSVPSYNAIDLIDGSGGNHYGWAEITPTSELSVTLNAFAYETTANTPFTGVSAPEPGVNALAVVGLLATGVAGLRRRRQLKRAA